MKSSNGVAYTMGISPFLYYGSYILAVKLDMCNNISLDSAVLELIFDGFYKSEM